MSIYNELMKTGNWSERQACLGEEFKFHCAYCDKNLLSCVDNHSEWQADHIIPTSKGGPDSMDNLALSCRTCNFIKGTWDPSENLPKEEIQKHHLIKLVRNRVSVRRQEMQKDLDLYKAILAKHG